MSTGVCIMVPALPAGLRRMLLLESMALILLSPTHRGAAEVVPGGLPVGYTPTEPHFRGSEESEAAFKADTRQLASIVKCDVCLEVTTALLFQAHELRNSSRRESQFSGKFNLEVVLTGLLDSICSMDMKPLAQAYELVQCTGKGAFCPLYLPRGGGICS